ncbi:MAG: hypothetical protein L0287_37865 [Anaerolineae bacterium]|nr:hypothetical protein [Anaerolineae bacterium]
MRTKDAGSIPKKQLTVPMLAVSLVTSFLIGCSTTQEDDYFTSEVTLVSSILRTNDVYFIRFDLVNNSKHNLSINEHALPWDRSNNVKITGIVGLQCIGTTLPIIDDVDDKQIRIPPGGRISGIVNIDHHLEWRQYLREADVDLFWVTRLRFKEWSSPQDFGGWVRVYGTYDQSRQ